MRTNSDTPRRQLRTPSKFKDSILEDEMEGINPHNPEISIIHIQTKRYQFVLFDPLHPINMLSVI